MDVIWSLQQLAIFAWFASGIGHLVVRARAGTGKTTTIIEACKHAGRGARILLAAFNKRIATELVTKLDRLGIRNVAAKTLHALGFAFIRQAWRGVRVDDDVDFDRARAACGPEASDEIVGIVKNLASKLKNVAPLTYDVEEVKDVAARFNLLPTADEEAKGWTLERVARSAGKARDAALDQDPAGRISFDDMVYVAVANDFARPQYDLVVIDEAQDMNPAQLLLAQRVVTKTGRIVVVGDDRQAIYGFRGADAGSIDRLKSELGATELGLTVTYRCGRSIVELARRFVGDFEAGAGNTDGIVDTCVVDALYTEAKPGDFILSRKNAPLMGLCLGFIKRGVRARIEGRDVGKALKDTVVGLHAKSVPHFIEKAQAWGRKQAKRAEKIANETRQAQRLSDIQDQVEVLIALADGCNSVNEILARCETLFGESREEKIPTVVLSSVHKAKGLEADRVFVLADTLSERNVEEQNIYYVAVTRARKHLTFAKPVLA